MRTTAAAWLRQWPAGCTGARGLPLSTPILTFAFCLSGSPNSPRVATAPRLHTGHNLPMCLLAHVQGTSIVRDPDSKRKRHSHRHGSHGWGRCCGAVDMRWLASGFVLGMLVFGGMSLFKVCGCFAVVHVMQSVDCDSPHGRDVTTGRICAVSHCTGSTVRGAPVVHIRFDRSTQTRSGARRRIARQEPQGVIVALTPQKRRWANRVTVFFHAG